MKKIYRLGLLFSISDILFINIQISLKNIFFPSLKEVRGFCLTSTWRIFYNDFYTYLIQAMTYIKGIGVKMIKKIFQRHLIITKTSYRHLEENSTKYNNHFDVPSNLDLKTVILFLVQFQW